MKVDTTTPGVLSHGGAPTADVMERELGEIVRRLQPQWPGVDVAAVVSRTYQRLAENARVTIYLPLLTEHLTRTWLSEQGGRHRTSMPAGRAT